MAPDQPSVRVDFYERFTRLLSREGLARGPSQTPGEFAVAASQELAGRLTTSGLDHVADNVATLFYRVRFGQQPLSADETARLNTLLSHLEAALSDKQK